MTWGSTSRPTPTDLRPPPASTASRSPTRASPRRPRWARTLPRRTLVIADEAHHLGEDLAWGDGVRARRSRDAPRGCCCPGTPFRSDATPIPGVRYDADGVASPTSPTPTPRRSRDGICRPVSFIPYDGTLSWRRATTSSSRASTTVLTSREASRALPHGDLHRAARRAAADPQGGRRQAAGHPRRTATATRAAWSSPPTPTHARQIAKLLRETTRPRAARRPARRGRARRQKLAGVHRARGPLDRRRQHGLRGRRHPTPARRRLRHRRQDAADLPPDRRAASCGRSRAAPRSRAGSTCPATRSCATTRPTIEQRAAPRPAPCGRGPTSSCSTSATSGAQTERSDDAGVRPAQRRRGAADDALRRPAPPPPPAAARSAALRAPQPAERRRGRTPRGEVPAFERRAQLRDKRHRLVAELRRRDGTATARSTRG